MYKTAKFTFEQFDPKLQLKVVATPGNSEVKFFETEDDNTPNTVKCYISESVTPAKLIKLGGKISSYITDDFAFESEVTDGLELLIEGLILGLTPTNIYAKDYTEPRAFKVCGEYEIENAYTTALVAARSYNLTRMLNTLPHCDCNPDSIVGIVQNAFSSSDVNISVLRARECANLELNGMLALARGSAYEPTLIKIEYCNSDADKIALVGKGIMFDTGGYSIKSGRDISGMKADMGGANAVIGAIHRLVNEKAKVNVVGYLMLTDNMINEHAQKPGDVIKYRNGLGVEVINTDAEGRLVLADGLLLAEAEGVNHIIDIATLTGNVGNALGNAYAGLITNSDEIASNFEQINSLSNEQTWRLPLEQSYNKYIKSDLADYRNSATTTAGGCMLAGLFLSKFVENAKWAHVDMAAMTDKGEPNSKYTGYGVRLLSSYVLSQQS